MIDVYDYIFCYFKKMHCKDLLQRFKSILILEKPCWNSEYAAENKYAKVLLCGVNSPIICDNGENSRQKKE